MGFPEAFIRNCHYSLHNNPEERVSLLRLLRPVARSLQDNKIESETFCYKTWRTLGWRRRTVATDCDSDSIALSRKSPVASVMSSVSLPHFGRMYQRGFHWTDFREIWYRRLLCKSVEKVQIWLKSGKHIRHFTWTPKYVVLFLTTLNRHKSTLLEWSAIRLLQ